MLRKKSRHGSGAVGVTEWWEGDSGQCFFIKTSFVAGGDHDQDRSTGML